MRQWKKKAAASGFNPNMKYPIDDEKRMMAAV